MTGFAVTGIPSSYRYPIVAVELQLAQGESTAAAPQWTTLIVGPKTSAGSGTVNTAYAVKSERDASTLAGPGSPIHRAVRQRMQVTRTGGIYIMPYAATSTGSAAASSATITVTATVTATCQIELEVCEELVTLVATTDSTATTIGDDIEGKINALTHLPFTASNSSGTVTLTSKIAGTSQNGIYRVKVKSVTPGTGVTVTASAATLGSGAEGDITENTNLAAALAAVEASRYYYVGITSPNSADIVTALSHVSTKSAPRPGLRSTLVFGQVGTLSATAAIAIAQNSELAECGWQYGSPHDPAQIVGYLIGILQEQEAVDAATNFDGYRARSGQLKPTTDQSLWPDSDDLNDAVTDGITPIVSTEFGTTVGMMCTTRSKDATGTLDDFRATERHRIAVLDRFADNVLQQWRLSFSNFKLQDDVYLADGTLNVNARIPERTMTPSRAKGWVSQRISDAVEDGQLQGESDWLESLSVRIDPQNTGRLQVSTAGRTIDLLHQATFLISETTPN